MGPDRLLVVSLGTGRKSANVGVSEGFEATSLAHAMRALASIMDDCGDLVETTMQWLSQSPTAREIDRELGKVEPGVGGAPRLTVPALQRDVRGGLVPRESRPRLARRRRRRAGRHGQAREHAEARRGRDGRGHEARSRKSTFRRRSTSLRSLRARTRRRAVRIRRQGSCTYGNYGYCFLMNRLSPADILVLNLVALPPLINAASN